MRCKVPCCMRVFRLHVSQNPRNCTHVFLVKNPVRRTQRIPQGLGFFCLFFFRFFSYFFSVSWFGGPPPSPPQGQGGRRSGAWRGGVGRDGAGKTKQGRPETVRRLSHQPRPTKLKTWFQKKTRSKLSVKTFGQDFRSKLSVKTFLAPKPLTTWDRRGPKKNKKKNGKKISKKYRHRRAWFFLLIFFPFFFLFFFRFLVWGTPPQPPARTGGAAERGMAGGGGAGRGRQNKTGQAGNRSKTVPPAPAHQTQNMVPKKNSVKTFGQNFRSKLSVKTFGQNFRSKLFWHPNP